MEYTRISSERDPRFDAAFELYEGAFPIHEQRLREKQAAVMANPLYHFDIITDGGVFVGILLYWEISFYTYIEHFAVHPSLRGKSMGGTVLAEFCAKHPFVVLEIDPPVNETGLRRERFYQRLNFLGNSCAHAHPPYRKQFPPHELVVMTCPRLMTRHEYEVFSQDLSRVVMKDALG